MWKQKVKVTLKTGEVIEVLPQEVEGLGKAGLLMEEKLEESEDIKKALENNQDQLKAEPIKQPAYRLPVLTTKQRRDRIRQAKKLKRQGYSQREIARRLNVSHVAVGKWLKK